MRISDWSSDVCSSDLIKILLIGDGMLKPRLRERADREALTNVIFHDPIEKHRLAGLLAGADIGLQTLLNVPAFYQGTSPNKFFDYIAADRKSTRLNSSH